MDYYRFPGKPEKMGDTMRHHIPHFPKIFAIPASLYHSRAGRDFSGLVNLTLKACLFEFEVEFKVIEPRDRRLYCFLREFVRHILIVSFHEIGIGGVVVGYHDRIMLHTDVAL